MSTLSLTWQMPPLLKLALFLGLIFSLFIFSFMKMACSQFSWDPYHFLPYCLTAAGLPLLCALLTMRSIRQQAPQQAFSTLGNAPSCLLPKAVKRLKVYFQGCSRSSCQYRASSLSAMKHDLGFARGVARLLTSTRSLIVVANIPNSSTIHHIALFSLLRDTVALSVRRFGNHGRIVICISNTGGIWTNIESSNIPKSYAP
jgi:hypothetical protein